MTQRLTLCGIILTAVTLTTFTGARADTLNQSSVACAALMTSPSIFNHIFVLGNGVNQNQLYVSWGRGSSWNWATLATSSLRPVQMACTAYNDQIVVVYRDVNSTLKSRDRLSGWQEVSLPGTFLPQGLWAEAGQDSGNYKIVLFSIASDGHMYKFIRDETQTPKWGSAVDLGAIPGGASQNLPTLMTGYSYVTGSSPAYQSVVSVFTVSNAGTLVENKGTISGSRSWIAHGLAPGNSAFSLFDRPTAVATYNGPQGHPDPQGEADQNRRVMVGTADQTTVYARISSGTGPWSWQAISGATTNPTYALDLIGAPTTADGGCSFGAPCTPATRTVGIYYVGNGAYGFANHFSRAQSSGTWSLLPLTAQPVMQPVLPKDRSYEQLFYIGSTTNAVVYDLVSHSTLNLGHP